MTTGPRLPLQNRVAPGGGIHAVAARGLFTGNRGGRLHGDDRRLRRARWKSKAWICCLTAFRGRHRPVMGNGYTELFFLDEAVALAAGHRPCFECRRADASEFARLWAQAHGLARPPRAPEMDRVLHADRLAPAWSSDVDNLPDGAIFRVGGDCFLKLGSRFRLWSFDGYAPSQSPPPTGPVDVLMSVSVCAVLQAGYRPALHPTAF